MTHATPTAPRKTAATGNARWLRTPTAADLDAGHALLRITADGRPAEYYAVKRLTDAAGGLIAYQLTKDDCTRYVLDCTFGGLAYATCCQVRDGREGECPSVRWGGYRPGKCKHRLALTAALAAVGL